MSCKRRFLLGAALGALLLPTRHARAERAALIVRYENDAQVRSLAAEGPTVIFFHARWCPSCHAAAREFSDRWQEVKPGIALVVADYDRHTELKARYGVTYQDTYVRVGADGQRLRIWNGGAIAALNANVGE
jgi:thioredoxin 1